MTTLDPQDGYIVLINTFTVDPERAEELCDVLSRATVEQLRPVPGFVSANLHVSVDRTHVANYAQWESEEQYKAIFDTPEGTAHIKQAADIAENYEPTLYQLRHAHGRPEGG